MKKNCRVCLYAQQPNRRQPNRSEPGRDGRTTRDPRGSTTERQPHGQVVREVDPLPRRGADRIVSRVVGDGDGRRKEGVFKDRHREEEPVKTRGGGEQGTGSNTKVSVRVVQGIN